MRLALVGPVYPYRGGIAHYTTCLYDALALAGHDAALYSFSRLYPRWLYPGRTDRDPSRLTFEAPCQYTLDLLNPWSWYRTARAVARSRPAALVIQWWVTLLAPMSALLAGAARRAGSKVIFVCHNVLPHEQRPWDPWLARRALGLGDAFIVQSQAERAALCALLPGRPVEVVGHPVNSALAAHPVSRQEARARLGLAPRAPVLLFFGFVRAYKGLACLLAALPQVQAALPDAHLLIAGEFWEDKGPYLRQIAQLAIETAVTIVDRYVPNEELPLYFAAADIAVLPYRHVTQSAVAQVAFGFGLPVITTQVGGLAEAVAHETTGLLVAPEDPDQLAAAVVRFFEQPGLAQRLRDGVQEYKSREQWERLVGAIERLAG